LSGKRRKTEGRNRAPEVILYFGRVQSAHLFEALNIISEIKSDAELRARVERCCKPITDFFDTRASFPGSNDHRMMAKMRTVVAFHYDSKLAMRTLKGLVEKDP
jgi:hypothetical protein